MTASNSSLCAALSGTLLRGSRSALAIALLASGLALSGCKSTGGAGSVVGRPCRQELRSTLRRPAPWLRNGAANTIQRPTTA